MVIIKKGDSDVRESEKRIRRGRLRSARKSERRSGEPQIWKMRLNCWRGKPEGRIGRLGIC